MMPPRKLSVSKCRSTGGALVGGMAVVDACVVWLVGVVVVAGCVVVTLGWAVVVLGWAVVVMGCTVLGPLGCGVVEDVGVGLVVVGDEMLVAAVVTGVDFGVVVGSSQRATTHSPQSSATATRSFIVCGTWNNGAGCFRSQRRYFA